MKEYYCADQATAREVMIGMDNAFYHEFYHGRNGKDGEIWYIKNEAWDGLYLEVDIFNYLGPLIMPYTTISVSLKGGEKCNPKSELSGECNRPPSPNQTIPIIDAVGMRCYNHSIAVTV